LQLPRRLRKPGRRRKQAQTIIAQGMEAGGHRGAFRAEEPRACLESGHKME
jgi:hypothetical protein